LDRKQVQKGEKKIHLNIWEFSSLQILDQSPTNSLLKKTFDIEIKVYQKI